jgi:aminoglycoside 3-N-acetyltransferase
MPNLNIPHEFTAENPPRWDLKGGEIGRKLGVVAQTFKDRFATHFSIHTTHSMMGRGPKAEALLSGHERVGLPCGPGTPWQKYALAGGKAILIGVSHKSNTTYHCAEECIPNSYRLSAEPVCGTVVVDGREMQVASRLHRWGISVDIGRINEELERRGALRRGKIGKAESIVILARPFLELAMAKLRGDPGYFLVKSGGDKAGSAP